MMVVVSDKVKLALFLVCVSLMASYMTYFRVVDRIHEKVHDRGWGASIGNLFANAKTNGHRYYSTGNNYSTGSGEENNTDSELPDYKIPNVVHYVRFDQPELTFVELVCILSAHLHLRPSRIIIHTNTVPSSGRYWRTLKERVGPRRLVLQQLDKPREVFGRPVRVVQHASDIARIRALIRHGGIYLDNDVYVVRPFERFRNLSRCSVGWPMDVDRTAYIGNQIFVCPPGDQFMKDYLNTYREKFDDGKWYYNAGQVPSEDLLHMNFSTERINAVPDSMFAVNTGHIGRIFLEGPGHAPSVSRWDWRTYMAIHLLYQHRSYMLKEDYAKYGLHDENKVKALDSAFGEMARLVYYGSEDMVTT